MCKILSRLKEVSDAEGISISTIEKEIGASRGVISKAIAKGTDIQSKWLTLICEKYPQISAVWLLTGKGQMLTSTTSATHPQIDNSTIPLRKLSQETRPRIPFDAAAGSLSVTLGSLREEDCERMPIIPTFPRYDFTIVARGESMEPQYRSGDELACALVHDSSFIQWGRAHVLDTSQGIVVKRIFDNGDSITCKSNNPLYPDFVIPKSDIYRIALVVGYIHIE